MTDPLIDPVPDPVSAREPVFNVPGVVAGLLLAMGLVHAGLALMPDETRLWWVFALGFVPARYAGLAAEIPGGAVAGVTSPLTHMLVHGGLAHLLLNGAWLLAFGGAVAARVGAARFLAVFTLSGLAGAALFWAINPDDVVPVVGASGAIAGLMGATMRFLFNAMDGGAQRLREAPREVPLTPLGEALVHPRILTATGLWLALNGLAALGLGGPGVGANDIIAWEAHIGGYLAGFLTIGWFDTGKKPWRPLPRA